MKSRKSYEFYFEIKYFDTYSLLKLQICCFTPYTCAIAFVSASEAKFVELTERGNSNRLSKFKIVLFMFGQSRVGNLVVCRGGDPEFSVTNFLKIIKVGHLDCSRVGILECCRVVDRTGPNINEISNLKSPL